MYTNTGTTITLPNHLFFLSQRTSRFQSHGYGSAVDLVYNPPPLNYALGSGAVKCGGVYVSSSAEHMEWLIGRVHISRFCSALSCFVIEKPG
jgi:hypothetical protein